MIPPITGGSDRNLLCLHTASRFILLFSTLRARVLKYIIALILYLSRGKCNVGCIFVDKGKGGTCRPQIDKQIRYQIIIVISIYRYCYLRDSTSRVRYSVR